MNMSYKYQKGVATLFVAVVLLIILTIVTIYAARVGLQDQRISGNDFRAKAAFSAAQTGLDYGEAFIKQNASTFISAGTLTTCPDLITFPCNYAADITWQYNDLDVSAINPLASGETFDVGYLLSPTDFVTIIGIGSSDDGTGNAVLREQVSVRTVLNTGPVPPVMAPGITAGGTFTVLGNPNIETDSVFQDGSGGSATGQMFSTWSKDPQNLGGSLQTCYPGDFQDNSGTQCIGPGIEDDYENTPTWNQCACVADRVYSSTNAGGSVQEDVVEQPTHSAFDDAFEYVFKLSRETMKGVANVVPNCDAIDNTSGQATSNIYWVTGDCDVNGGEMGSLADPIIVVVVGDIAFQGQAHAWGIVMGIDGSEQPPLTPCADPTGISVVGGFNMHGALISDCDLDLGAGTFNAMYNEDVFDNLKNSTKNNFLSRNVGSWRDF